jgi:hypothetical protein
MTDLNYLEQLVDDRESESFELEFKQSAALQTEKKQRESGNKKPINYGIEVSKDVSAMANANGGRIIYGIVDDNSRATSLDDGSPVQERKSEWIDQICAHHIHPRIDGIRITPILADNGNQYFVVDVPKATTLAPHQAGDKVYYQRQNTTTVALEDYQIRDLRARAVSPDLILKITSEYVSSSTVDDQVVRTAKLLVSATNLSDTPSLYTTMWFYLDERLETQTPQFWTKGSTALLTYDGSSAGVSLQLPNIACTSYSRNYSVPGSMPFFRGVDFTLFDAEIKAQLPKEFKANRDFVPYLYGWSIIAPGCSKKTRLGLLLLSHDCANVAGEVE